VHRYPDEIDFARNGPIRGVVGITEAPAKRESAVVRETILRQAQRLCFGSGQHIGVT
jgi:hypothetical protein